jgi:hypothetical protein
MDENGLYAKQTCNLAGVLTTCTSEACESEIKYIRATEGEIDTIHTHAFLLNIPAPPLMHGWVYTSSHWQL